MACWNLDESTGNCKKTDSVCSDNEFSCPIAKDERRIAFAQSRKSGGSSGSVGSSGTGSSVLIVLGLLVVIGGFFLDGGPIILGGIAMLALGVFLKTKSVGAILIVVGIGAMVIGFGSLPNHESRDLPIILTFAIVGAILLMLGIILALRKAKNR